MLMKLIRCHKFQPALNTLRVVSHDVIPDDIDQIVCSTDRIMTAITAKQL